MTTTPLSTPLDPEVFLEAAMLLERGGLYGHCCPAVEHVCIAQGRSWSPYLRLLRRFKPAKVGTGEPWFGAYTDFDNRRRRVLALLLCAAMAGDGETGVDP